MTVDCRLLYMTGLGLGHMMVYARTRPHLRKQQVAPRSISCMGESIEDWDRGVDGYCHLVLPRASTQNLDTSGGGGCGCGSTHCLRLKAIRRLLPCGQPYSDLRSRR